MDKAKKSSKKAKEAKAKEAKAADPEMQAPFLADHKKAKDATENAKSTMTATANRMFGFYPNFLTVKAKYVWNKIVEEQMKGDPYVDLQGVSHKCPRGVSCQSVEDCVMFYLLLCSPSTRLSKRSIISPTCSRSPSMLACINLCIL
jgi:hypothetical protein